MRKHPVHLGELTEPVELHSFTSASDGSGGSTAAWAKYADVWAHVRPLSGAERQAAQRTEAQGVYLFVIRSRTDVREKHKVVWEGRGLDIEFVRARGPRDLYLEFEAKIGVRP